MRMDANRLAKISRDNISAGRYVECRKRRWNYLIPAYPLKWLLPLSVNAPTIK